MKINIFRAIIIILLLGTFGMIFGFSNQNSEKSSNISTGVTNKLVRKIKYIQEKPDAEREKIIDTIEKIIRKLAHFSVYTLVGILIMTLLLTYNLKENSQISISFIVGILYAISDEIHQCFVPRKRANGGRRNFRWYGSLIRNSNNFVSV